MAIKTKQFQEELHRLSVGLDQSVQTLQRAREAAIGMHKNHLRMLGHQYQEQSAVNDEHLKLYTEYLVYASELRGLGFAIQDKELLALINAGDTWIEPRDIVKDEMALRGKYQKIHTRIAQLLEEMSTL